MEKKTVVKNEVDSNLETNSDLTVDMKDESISETGSEEFPEVDNPVNARVPSRTVRTSISQDENLKEATPNWEGLKNSFIATIRWSIKIRRGFQYLYYLK